MNDLDTLLGPALRDRMRTEHPDLERLAARSLRAGTRLRRRRQVAAVAGGAAGIAVLAVATSQVGGGTTAIDPPAPAADPTADPTGATAASLRVGQVLDLGNGLTGTVTRDKTGLYELGASTLPGAGTGFVVVVTGPIPSLETWWSSGFDTLTEDWPGITVAVSSTDADALGMLGKVEKAPVTVGAGWTCEWFLEDDKASCASSDGGVASLVIRDAAERDAWLGSGDKGATSSVFTTEAHDGIFISVQGGRGTTDAEIRELGQSLAWVD